MVKKLWSNRFIRFLVVGVINTLFGYGAFVVLLYVGMHYSLAAFLGTVLGILFNFNTVGRLVFKSHNNWRIFQFFGVYGVTYILNVIGLFLFKKIGINAYVGGALLIVPVAIVAYLLNKHFVFTEITAENASKKDEGV